MPAARTAAICCCSQSLYNYEAFTRSTVTEDNNAGEPALATDDDAELAQATLQHVVVTYDPVEGRRIYVNGVFTAATWIRPAAACSTTGASPYAVVLGNSHGGCQPLGGCDAHGCGSQSRRLRPGQVVQNFDVGRGAEILPAVQRGRDWWTGRSCHVMDAGERTNYCYVVFEVSQFDDGSYLFNQAILRQPQSRRAATVEFDLRGIRLGINGKLAHIGQAFVNVDAAHQQWQAAVRPGCAGARLAASSRWRMARTRIYSSSPLTDVDGQAGAADDGVSAAFPAHLDRREVAPISACALSTRSTPPCLRLTGVPMASRVSAR